MWRHTCAGRPRRQRDPVGQEPERSSRRRRVSCIERAARWCGGGWATGALGQGGTRAPGAQSRLPAEAEAANEPD